MSDLLHLVPKALIEALRKHRCIPFVGSGASLPFGLPTWDSVIDRLAIRCLEEKKPNTELITAESREGRYPEAARDAREKLGAALYQQEMERLFTTYDRSVSRELHQAIWKLVPPMVITTNYDLLLEHSTTPRPMVVTPNEVSKLASLISDRPRKVLFKIHGSIDHFDSVVFTEQDYAKLYEGGVNAYQLSVLSPIAENHLLFLGYGLRDKAVLAMLRYLFDKFQGFSGVHYALMCRGEAQVEELWRKYNISVIEYDSHDRIAPLLKEITDTFITQGRASGSVPAKKRGPEGGGSEKPRIAASDLVPSGLRKHCIGECIFLVGYPFAGGIMRWQEDDIVIQTKPKFLPPNAVLEEIRSRMLSRFEKLQYLPTPRFSLREVTVEPKDTFRNRGLTVSAELTDWGLVHGVQEALADKSSPNHAKVADLFWASAGSLVHNLQSAGFPHHLAVHCVLVTKDSKLILNRRVSVSNQRNRISASFEEQMQFPFIYPADHKRAIRCFDGDESPVDTIARGAREELGIDLARKDITILALCLEASSVAANFLALAKSPLTASEIYLKWQGAEDKWENAMVDPELLPAWDPALLAPLLSQDTLQGVLGFDEFRWHASSRARIILGLLADFGFDAVLKYVTLP